MRPSRPFVALVAVVAIAVAGCTGGDDGDQIANGASSPTSDPDGVDAAQPTAGLPVTTLDAPSAETVAPTSIETSVAPSRSATSPQPSVSQPPPSEPPASDPVETVPESGVPGLDSDDLFCAAWSRFGGTWQVLLVGSTFLDDPELVARWEVASAPLVVGAHSELFAQLPAELESERAALADGYFGVFERRALDARDALVGSGANGGDIAGLSEAWLAALESRDPATPDVEFVEPDALVGLVDVASAELLGRRNAFHLDPSLIVTVETPLTDAYLESNCPDQGTLAGGEVDG